MKKILLIICIFSITVSSAYSRPPAKITRPGKFCLTLLKEHDPQGYHLISHFLQMKKFSENDFFGFLKNDNINSILYRLPILVHETSHMYTMTNGGTKEFTGKLGIKRTRTGAEFFFQGNIKITYSFMPKSIPRKLSPDEMDDYLDKIKNKNDRKIFKSIYKPFSSKDILYFTGKYRKEGREIRRILATTDYFKEDEEKKKRALAPLHEYGYYFDQKNRGTIRYSRVFPSSRIAKLIPPAYRNFSNNRYDIYINTRDYNLGTQQHGIYGLFDEFNAYYNGTRTAVNLLPYVKKNLSASPEAWRNYLKALYWQYWSYYDFKYYMLQYMLHGKTLHTGRSVYKDIMSNSDFRKAYTELDKKWIRLLTRFEKTKQETFSHMKAKGFSVTENDTYTIIKKGRYQRRVLNFNHICKKLKVELEDKKYRGLLSLK